MVNITQYFFFFTIVDKIQTHIKQIETRECKIFKKNLKREMNREEGANQISTQEEKKWDHPKEKQNKEIKSQEG